MILKLGRKKVTVTATRCGPGMPCFGLHKRAGDYAGRLGGMSGAGHMYDEGSGYMCETLFEQTRKGCPEDTWEFDTRGQRWDNPRAPGGEVTTRHQDDWVEYVVEQCDSGGIPREVVLFAVQSPEDARAAAATLRAIADHVEKEKP